MSNFAEVKSELINYIYARTPLVIIHTDERERVERMLNEIAENGQISMMYYTDAKQIRYLGSKAENIDTENEPLEFFLKQIKRQRNLNIVLGDVRRISDDNAYSRELMNILYMAKENNGVVILITTDQAWSRISSFGMVVSLDRPDGNERIAQIKSFIKRYAGRFSVDWTSEDIVHAAALLKGFSEIQIENLLSAEIIGNQGLKRDKIYKFASQKEKLYPKVGAVQHINVNRSYKVAGMDRLKEWLEEKKRVFFLPEEQLNEYELSAPKGILLVGVPGCGKSLTAKLVAQEWELPLFRFDIGSVFDKWVGESEKKMREALQFIENISPCVLWIDEIEKVLSTTDSGNETGKRVLGEFLFWIQESSNKVFMVATANNVKALPYELYRKGRFSEVFYAGLPNDEERKCVLNQYINGSLKSNASEELLNRLVEMTSGYSYADIETAVKEVAQKMIIRDNKSIDENLLINSIKSIIPISTINTELVAEIEKWGSERAINVSN